MSFIEQIEENRKLFLSYNRLKNQRFEELLTGKNVFRTIQCVPFLFSVNHPKLPGFVEGAVPLGVCGYTPDKGIRSYLETRYHISKLPLPTGKPLVQMLAVMGSVGTIAYTRQSDFDWWICIERHAVSEDAYRHFTTKVKGIQDWCTSETKIEIHFFVNDIENIRKNIFAESEEEAFGSTTGALLKDEFYRSSILIAGKIPFWWVVPQFVPDSEYRRLLESLPEDIREEQYIDLGNLYAISREDFLGAALFQLIKSLGNPFKSILKIGLLEKYLFDQNKTPLLSQKVKANILRGNLENSIIDAYILMFEEVYQFYETTLDDRDLLTILRQNLYLKINPQLSKYAGMTGSKKLPYSVSVMFSYMKQWRWSPQDITDLDNFNRWDYSRVMQFWNLVQKFMLLTYQHISRDLPTLNLAKKISENDFKLLSRKIKTHFTSAPNKIDQYITFTDTPHEPILYIEPVSSGNREMEWRLLKNIQDAQKQVATIVIKNDTDLVKLLAWCAINQIYDPTFSRIQVQSGYQRINPNQVRELLSAIHGLFLARPVPIKNRYLTAKPFTFANMIILNFNLENAEQIQNTYHLYQTSWGESCVDRSEDPWKLVEIIVRIISDGQKLRRPWAEAVAVVAPEPARKIYRDMEKWFREIYEFLVTSNARETLVLVTRYADQVIILTRDPKRQITASRHASMIKALATLSLKPKHNVTCTFMGDDQRFAVMDAIAGKSRDNAISLLFETKGALLFMYCINERGNIFTFVKQATRRDEILLAGYRFCKDCISRINSLNHLPDINSNVSVFQLIQNEKDDISLNYVTGDYETRNNRQHTKRIGLGAVIDRYMTDTAWYSFIFPDGTATEFITLDQVPGCLGPHFSGQPDLLTVIESLEIRNIAPEHLEGGSSLFFVEKFRLELVMNRLGTEAAARNGIG